MRPLEARIEALEAKEWYWEFQMGLEVVEVVFAPAKSRPGYVIFKIVFNHLNMLQ